jgi:P-type E1-E2 ATPase
VASKSSGTDLKRLLTSRFVTTSFVFHSEELTLIQKVVVGDIALVEPGEIIPCDRIFISGHNVKRDESGATGESDSIKKVPYADVELTCNAPAGSLDIRFQSHQRCRKIRRRHWNWYNEFQSKDHDGYASTLR